MDEEHPAEELSPAQQHDFQARLARGEDQTPFTAAERAFLIEQTILAKRKTKDLLMERLMVVNEYSKNKRAEELAAAGSSYIGEGIFLALDALDAAIEETAVFVTNIDEGPDGKPSMAAVMRYAREQASATLVLDEYRAYAIIAEFFEPKRPA